MLLSKLYSPPEKQVGFLFAKSLLKFICGNLADIAILVYGPLSAVCSCQTCNIVVSIICLFFFIFI